MCCDSAEVQAADLATQKAQTALTTAAAQNYSTDFSESQTVLANLQAKLTAMAANPLGYTPEQLKTATSSIDQNTATAAKQAIGAAAAFAGRNGTDVGSGPTGQLAAQITSGAAQSKASQLASLSEQNQALKTSNYWNAIQGLNSVGAQYSGQGASAIGGANDAAEGVVNAGSGIIAANNAGWQDAASLLGGIGGLVTGGAGIAKAFMGGGGGGN